MMKLPPQTRTLALAALATCLTAAPLVTASPTDDAFLAGYAQAVVDAQAADQGVTVTAKDGTLSVALPVTAQANRENLTQRLEALPNVRQVIFTDGPANANTTATTAASTDVNQTSSNTNTTPREKSATAPAPRDPLPHGEWFPRGRLFEPLIADPRWPHFGAAYTHYMGESVTNVATVSFGESISFYRRDVPDWLPLDGQFEAVLQPGVFAIFDLGSTSGDLLNADYFIGGGLAWNNGPWSALARIFHQSSHLGDEYLLANPGITRVNLSYEQANLLLSYDFSSQWRVYGGAGLLFDQDPAGFDPLVAQYGAQWRSPWSFHNGWLTPVAAVDVKHWEETDWSADLSVRAGVELRDPSDAAGHRMQILLEYFNGHSPNGQFYSESIRYLGLGLHFYY